VGDVLEGEGGPRPCLGWCQRDLDPGDLAAELPGDPVPARWFARLDGAAGVALDAVPAAFAQITGHRKEPAADPLGAGHGVPQVVDVGWVGVLHRQAARREALVLDRPDTAGDLAKLVDR
jgi:hypothetical protein